MPNSTTCKTCKNSLPPSAPSQKSTRRTVQVAGGGDEVFGVRLVNKAEQNKSKTIRDKAYTHLKELVDEIREAGKYVFRKDKNRLIPI